jgi:dTDP-4-dehydrorhamnose 3,5-epimerase
MVSQEASMILAETTIPGVFIVQLQPRTDERGSFTEAFNSRDLREAGIHFQVDQVFVSESIAAGAIRGMHYQEAPHGQMKLVRCLRGSVYDAVIDVRPDSPSFGNWFGLTLTPENRQSILVPRGVAHGWQALEAGSMVEYLAMGLWRKEAEKGVSPEDPRIGIAWPLPIGIMCQRDRDWPPFA